jgi:hypothetical protein
MTFPKWNNDFNKLFERLQEAYGSSTEEYNHIISSIFNDLGASQIFVFGDIPYIIDPLRGKYVSVARVQQGFGYYGPNQSSRYLRLESVTSSGNGYMVMRDGVITGLSTRCRNGVNYQVQIRKNDQETPLFTLNANAGVGVADTLDINVNKGDFLQLYMDGNSIDHPLAFLELAWRYEEQ